MLTFMHFGKNCLNEEALQCLTLAASLDYLTAAEHECVKGAGHIDWHVGLLASGPLN